MALALEMLAVVVLAGMLVVVLVVIKLGVASMEGAGVAQVVYQEGIAHKWAGV